MAMTEDELARYVEETVGIPLRGASTRNQILNKLLDAAIECRVLKK